MWQKLIVKGQSDATIDRMTGITVRKILAATACTASVVVAAAGATVPVATAAPVQPAPPHSTPAGPLADFTKPGPLKVATNYAPTKCSSSLMGTIMLLQARGEGITEEMTCSLAFPYGPESPVGVQIFAPVGKAAKGPYPAVIFMPGIGGNPSQYTALARNWASHGFIIAMPFTFWNSLIEVPSLGTAVLAYMSRDPGNPLFRRVDWSRISYAGHSAGGQGALQAASLYPSTGTAIDPRFHVVSVFAIANGPLALGSTVNVPALVLGGRLDNIVPPWAWQTMWQFNGMQSAPAYFAVSRTAHHLDVARSARTNPFLGVTTAWLMHVAYHDPAAARVFLGKDWSLPHDKSFDEVKRNRVAARALPKRPLTEPTGNPSR